MEGWPIGRLYNLLSTGANFFSLLHLQVVRQKPIYFACSPWRPIRYTHSSHLENAKFPEGQTDLFVLVDGRVISKSLNETNKQCSSKKISLLTHIIKELLAYS